jgi:hypothetical protein
MKIAHRAIATGLGVTVALCCLWADAARAESVEADAAATLAEADHVIADKSPTSPPDSAAATGLAGLAGFGKFSELTGE